jgi:hypothetical protein
MKSDESPHPSFETTEKCLNQESIMSVKETKNKSANELFDQAMKSFEESVQYGLKVQTESIQCWNDLIRKAEIPNDWKKKVEAVLKETLPTVEKNTKDALALMESNRQASLALLNQALQAVNSQSVSEYQSNVQGIWESGLDAIRKNSELLVQANAKAIDQWSQFVTKVTANA